MKVVTCVHCGPFIGAERCEDAGVVKFICRAGHVAPNGALQCSGVRIPLRVWMVDTRDEFNNGVGVAFHNGTLFHGVLGDALSVFIPPCLPECCCHQSRVLEIEHAVDAQEFRVVGYSQEVQRALQSSGQSVRGHNLLTSRKSIRVGTGEQEIAHRLGISGNVRM